MTHIVLLGDSIFDNAAYVNGAPDVITRLRARLPRSGNATLRAIDGSCIRDVPAQLSNLPRDATHLVLSVGGNDALGYYSILSEPANSFAEVLDRLADIGDKFGREYRQLLETIRKINLPLVICTIYDPNFADPIEQKIAKTALIIFNDAIIRSAVRSGIPLLDLRVTCNERTDYANPIEPSTTGAEKIAIAILKTILQEDFSQSIARVFS